jgi:hypothetical protein
MTAMLRSLRRSEFPLPLGIAARVETVKGKFSEALPIASLALGLVVTIVWVGCLAWLLTQAVAAVV